MHFLKKELTRHITEGLETSSDEEVSGENNPDKENYVE